MGCYIQICFPSILSYYCPIHIHERISFYLTISHSISLFITPLFCPYAISIVLFMIFQAFKITREWGCADSFITIKKKKELIIQEKIFEKKKTKIVIIFIY